VRTPDVLGTVVVQQHAATVRGRALADDVRDMRAVSSRLLKVVLAGR
jgi:hypothetical protein